MQQNDESEIEKAILHLGRMGCSGTEEEFTRWLLHKGISTEPDRVKYVLEALVQKGSFQRSGFSSHIFSFAGKVVFPAKVEYFVPGKISLYPVPYIRSQIEAFLRNKTADERIIADILTASTEAIENAIKYNSSENEPIRITYGANQGIFSIQIVNRTIGMEIEHDIRRGKFDPATTLMRGMLVIMKLFDSYEISITENNGLVTFYAEKKLA
jgi:anti-sigma regulatory factor (Ser/Thr protein kinase)